MSQKHKMHVEAAITEVLKLVTLSKLMQQNFQEIQSNCSVSGCSVSWSQFHKFCELIVPTPKHSCRRQLDLVVFIQTRERQISYADQLSACTRQVKWYIDSELSAVVGTTYHDLRQFVEAIDIATLFERSSARSHQSDIDVRESNLLHADQQVSGDENDDSVMPLMNDAEQVIRLEAAVSDINKFSAAWHADGINTLHADGVSALRADGVSAVHADGISALRADGVSAPRADGVSALRADGVSAPHADGVSAVHADGVSAPCADGVSAPRADGVSAPHADGVSAPGADGVSAVHADGVSAPRADGVSAVRDDGVSAPHADSDDAGLCNSMQMTPLNRQCRRGRLKSGCPTLCSYCGKQFPTPSALNVHTRIHTGYRPFVCSHCPWNFTQLCHLMRHIHHRHATSKPYVCAYCPKPFASAPLLRKHLQTHGMETTAPSRRIVGYSCQVCGLMNTKWHLVNRHLRNHTHEQPFLCSECGRSFADASCFYRHQRSHSPAVTVPCAMCGKTFGGMDLLRQHQKTHSDARPHVCTECHRGFKRLGDLRVHCRIHTGDRPYGCKVCPAAFTQSSSLRYHMMVHSDERSHTCCICSRRFRAADKLRVHALMHSGERPHTCEKCGRSFSDRSAFRRHMRRCARRQQTS